VSKKLGWRVILISFMIVMALLYLVPSLSEEAPPWWSSFLPQEKIRLGLDLQGGMHLVLEVEVTKAIESDLERSVEDIKDDLRESKIRYMELKRNGTKGIDITLMREEDVPLLEGMQESRYPDYELEKGNRVEKGVSYTMVLKQETKNQIMEMATDQALETIRNRIDQFGVSEPDIRPQGDNRILVQLPGIKDTDRAIELIGKTAQLEFKLVDEENSLEDALAGDIPAGDEILYEESTDYSKGAVKKEAYLVKKRTSLTGQYISDARVAIDRQYNEPYVLLSFNNKGARIFERLTEENVGKRLAIVLDNKVYSDPVIKEKIPGSATGNRAEGRRPSGTSQDPGRKDCRSFPRKRFHTKGI
jgi:preprotein translocase subunit SecD